MGTDFISLGGWKVDNQAIELANTVSSQFQQGSGDGVLGLAFSNTNTGRTLVESLIAKEDIPKSAELFTAKLGRWKSGNQSDKEEPFYTFGCVDQETVDATGEEIYYTPIDKSQGLWLFDSPSASVNGKTITRSGNKSIADTGTRLALVDDDLCKCIYDTIPGSHYDEDSQGYIYPTNTTEDNLPLVSLAVGEKQFVVRKQDLGFTEAKSGYIYGGIQSRGTMTMDVLGLTFLTGIYAVSHIPYFMSHISNAGRYSMLVICNSGQYSRRTCGKACLFPNEQSLLYTLVTVNTEGRRLEWPITTRLDSCVSISDWDQHVDVNNDIIQPPIRSLIGWY